MKKQMTFLITGAAGFIGSSLADKLLSQGNIVYGIDNFDPYYSKEIKKQNIKLALQNSNYHFSNIDILDKDLLTSLFASAHPDFIIHLAAKAGVRPSIANPVGYEKANFIGTGNIMEAAKENGINNLIIASSSSVYGNNKKIPFSETDSVDRPISPYAATKKATELLGYVYHHLYNENLIFLRFFTVYGPRQRPDLAINHFMKATINGEPIHIYGDGETARDYTFIDDIVDGIIKSAQYLESNKSVYEIINLGSNRPIKLREMVETIAEVAGKSPIIIHDPMQPGDVDITFADISKAQKLLGYKPSISFKDGIKSFYKWFVSTNCGLSQ